MKTNSILFLMALTILVSSCSTRLSYFTKELQDEHQWTDSELKKIQFYISKDIVLKRHLTGGSSEIVSGRIKVENGRKVEEYIIRRGTPGVLVFSPKTDRFAISFEADNDSRYLMFGPNPKFNERFALLASEWKNRNGQVTYDGKSWSVGSEDAYASLLVDLRKIQRVSVSSQTAKGRKVN